ncbi:MAG: putative Calponin homology domain [Streblomastix strix]|uniref:Putative Calponin homology domain n=1 Tax=Streblomastix strix TaxID=222440 RepID=A0A5J4W121_9EUKA|nr:MAG: putative Calponin homology domain [Streblomastix strix]
MYNFSNEQLGLIYEWVDSIQLSRSKKNIARDFSDGVLMAEICKQCFPKFVDLHNYSESFAVPNKIYNWETLNAKVFQRIGFRISREDINAVASAVPGAIEFVLIEFNRELTAYYESKNQKPPIAPMNFLIEVQTPKQQDVTSPLKQEQTNSQPIKQNISIQNSHENISKNNHRNSGQNDEKSQIFSLKALLSEKEKENAELREANEMLKERVNKLELQIEQVLRKGRK